MIGIRESTPAERAAYAVYMMANGRPLSTDELARATGSSLRAAQRTMAAISRSVPVRRDGVAWTLDDGRLDETERISDF